MSSIAEEMNKQGYNLFRDGSEAITKDFMLWNSKAPVGIKMMSIPDHVRLLFQ